MEMGDTSGLKKYLAFCRRTREGGSRAREGLDQHDPTDGREGGPNSTSRPN
jgi:hypothetical protein